MQIIIYYQQRKTTKYYGVIKVPCAFKYSKLASILLYNNLEL